MDAIEKMRFEKGASVEAIRYEIGLAQQDRARAERRLLWLLDLMSKRLEQKQKGEWPTSDKR